MMIKAVIDQLSHGRTDFWLNLPLKSRTIDQTLFLAHVGRLVLTVLIPLSLVSCQAPATKSALPAQVERVLSGQTLEIRFRNEPQTLQIRLWGISAPDRQQKPWAGSTYRFLAQHVQHQPITVELLQQTPDRYGRFWGRIWIQNQLLNEQLVAEGHALVRVNRTDTPSARDTQYDQRLVWAQQRARILGLGIWNPRSPLRQTPTEFRKQPLSPL
jgi:micrococcal nuclease